MKKLFLFAAAFAALTFASSCSKEDDGTKEPESQTETLTVGNITVPKDCQVLEASSVTASRSKSTSAAEGSTIQYEAFLSGDCETLGRPSAHLSSAALQFLTWRATRSTCSR